LKIIKSLPQKLYILWVGLVFTFFMILFLPGLTLPFFFGLGSVGYFFLWIWSWIFSKLTFIRYKFYGREKIDRNKAYIYVSNHTSFLDLPGIRMMIPGQFRPLAKKELLRIPIFGWIAGSATVIVDRSSSQSRKRSLDKLKKILHDGISILIFAEGTQNRTKELLQPFKDGAFRLAVDTQETLLPLVVVGAGPLMPPGTVRLRPGLIRVFVGEPVSAAGLGVSDVPALKEKVYDQMKEILVKNSDA